MSSCARCGGDISHTQKECDELNRSFWTDGLLFLGLVVVIVTLIAS